MNRRSAVIDANGHRSELTYDLGGRLIETKDANGNVTTYEYDALGRQTKAITAQGYETQTQYDASGNVTHVTDANAVAGLQPTNNQAASVYRQYDELNRLTLERDALNGNTAYTYDLLGVVVQEGVEVALAPSATARPKPPTAPPNTTATTPPIAAPRPTATGSLTSAPAA